MKKITLLLSLLSTFVCAQQPQVANTNPQPLQGINAKWNQGVGTGYWATIGTGLTLNVTSGTCFDNTNTRHTYSGGTMTMTNSTTNYIYLTAAACTLSQNTSGYGSDDIPIASVVTSGGVITGLIDNRTWFNASGGTTTAQKIRVCIIDNDTQSASALLVENFSGRCEVGAAGTIIEIDVLGGTGVLTGSAAAPTVTGTSSVQVGKYTPSSGSSTTSLMSAALATSSGKACALPTAGSATCPIFGITQAGSSLSITTTSLAAGDVLFVSAATPDTTQTWYSVFILFTVN